MHFQLADELLTKPLKHFTETIETFMDNEGQLGEVSTNQTRLFRKAFDDADLI